MIQIRRSDIAGTGGNKTKENRPQEKQNITYDNKK